MVESTAPTTDGGPPLRRRPRVRPRFRVARGLLFVALSPAAVSGAAGGSPAVGSAEEWAPCPARGAPELVDRVRNRLEAARSGAALAAAGERIHARGALPAFYASRGWAPAWFDGTALSLCGRRVLDAVAGADADGLEADDYHLDSLDALGDRVRSGSATTPERVDLELLLTDAWLTLGSHLLQGRVNPSTVEAEWLANRRRADMGALLETALGDGDPGSALARLRPSQPEYERLRDKLAELRAAAAEGGWGTVPDGPTLHPGDDDPRVPALRTRLAAGGDLTEADGGGGTVFDDGLREGVVRFQTRHGLDADGEVGPRTLQALAVPVEARIRQVRVNLERWRWLPEELGSRHIRVNIADYRVEVWDSGRVGLEMRAVVGRAYRETPMFSAQMSHLVLSPYWHVPPGIAVNDKLPELRRNPGYLAAQRMSLLTQGTGQPVDAASVDFEALSGAEFNRQYRIRQDPGPLNALGRVKFMFPNVHNVYLHDTPSRELFGRTERAFSSGCVRLERPLELAEYLLAGRPEWSAERIRSAAEAPTETTVRFATPIPVHILYWTSFVDEEGRVHFRPDLYGRDARVQRGLDAEPPAL